MLGCGLAAGEGITPIKVLTKIQGYVCGLLSVSLQACRHFGSVNAYSILTYEDLLNCLTSPYCTSFGPGRGVQHTFCSQSLKISLSFMD